jgi:hypothetical protein
VAQQQVLAPLKQDWASIDPNRKQKWLEVAARFPSMPQEERARVQTRMAEWARLSPSERSQARLQFQQAKTLSPEERQARWQQYQALPEAERVQLAARARPAASQARPAEVLAKARPASEPGSGKRNVVPLTPPSPGGVVAPTVVQAKPGATTTTMTTRVAPPVHHQPGLPKIAAAPGFVDPATLLPQRGPQGAAVKSAAVAASANRQP